MCYMYAFEVYTVTTIVRRGLGPIVTTVSNDVFSPSDGKPFTRITRIDSLTGRA